MTEIGVGVTVSALDSTEEQCAEASGYPLPGYEIRIVDPETGRRYRREVLETGGSRPAMASFTAFRGREPRIDALLRHQGLEEAVG